MAGLEGVRVDRKVGDQDGLKKGRVVLEGKNNKEGTNVEMHGSGEGQREINTIGLHLVEVMHVNDLNISIQAEKDKEEGKDAGDILRIKDRN